MQIRLLKNPLWWHNQFKKGWRILRGRGMQHHVSSIIEWWKCWQSSHNFDIRSVCANWTDCRQNDVSYRLVQSILKEDCQCSMCVSVCECVMHSEGGPDEDQEGEYCWTHWMINAKNRPLIEDYYWAQILGVGQWFLDARWVWSGSTN